MKRLEWFREFNSISHHLHHNVIHTDMGFPTYNSGKHVKAHCLVLNGAEKRRPAGTKEFDEGVRRECRPQRYRIDEVANIESTSGRFRSDNNVVTVRSV